MATPRPPLEAIFAIVFVVSGCGDTPPQSALVADPPPVPGVRFENPKDRDSFKIGGKITVAGLVTVPPSARPPDVFTIQILQDGRNSGTYAAKLKPTSHEGRYRFERELEPLTRPGPYLVRGETIYLDAPTPKTQPGKSEGAGEKEIARNYSKSIQINLIPNKSDSKTREDAEK